MESLGSYFYIGLLSSAFYDIPLALLLQLCALPIVCKTAMRKHIPMYVCGLMILPYIGVIVAFWIACAPESPPIEKP